MDRRDTDMQADTPSPIPLSGFQGRMFHASIDTLVADLLLVRDLAFRERLGRTAAGAEALLVTLMREVAASPCGPAPCID